MLNSLLKRLFSCAIISFCLVAITTDKVEATVIYDFTPTDPTITDVSGFFEISNAAFENRSASNTTGEILDFSFSFFASDRFGSSGSFSLSVNRVVTFSFDSSGDFLSSLLSLSELGECCSIALRLDAANDTFFLSPNDREIFVFDDASAISPCITAGDWIRRGSDFQPREGRLGDRDRCSTPIPPTPAVHEPTTLALLGLGLAGLCFARRKTRS